LLIDLYGAHLYAGRSGEAELGVAPGDCDGFIEAVGVDVVVAHLHFVAIVEGNLGPVVAGIRENHPFPDKRLRGYELTFGFELAYVCFAGIEEFGVALRRE